MSSLIYLERGDASGRGTTKEGGGGDGGDVRKNQHQAVRKRPWMGGGIKVQIDGALPANLGRCEPGRTSRDLRGRNLKDKGDLESHAQERLNPTPPLRSSGRQLQRPKEIGTMPDQTRGQRSMVQEGNCNVLDRIFSERFRKKG